MKFLAYVHMYPPLHNSGAELMLHEIFKYLQSQGHDCKVVVRQTEVAEHEGIPLTTELTTQDFAEADAIFTHLDRTGDISEKCWRSKKPLFHLVHNSIEYKIVRRRVPYNYVIYNSEWIKEALQYQNESIIVNPPVWAKDYKVSNKGAEYITLINCNENKGGAFLIQLAKLMPEHKFMAVIGSYNEQIIDKSVHNITYVPHTPNIKDVYRKTKILLMPSIYESWGRTAIEACASGIPVIANATPGLKESLGDAGIFANPLSGKYKKRILELLGDDNYYKEVSEKCKKRAKELDPGKQLKALNSWIINLLG